MAEDVLLKPESSNSCCKAWKDKYIKLEEKRNALRQAVKLLEQQIKKIQAENLNLKEGYEEEKARASIEREGKEKESGGRVSLEKEILDLKSQISSLEQNNVNALSVHGEVKRLNALIADNKKEINKLKELLETEKKRVETEMKNAEMRKEEATQARRAVLAERSKASDLRKFHKIEVEKVNECRQQMEMLKEESEEVKLKLASETSKLIQVRKELEVEKQKTIKDKERAKSEMSKAEALRIQAEANRKKAEEEKSRADSLFQQLERKSCEIEELQKQVKELQTFRNSGEARFEHALSSEHAEMKLLKKKLKFEKMRLKHARQVADLEKSHRSIIKQEMDRVKLEFVQIANHLDTVHKFALTGPTDDTNEVGKSRNAENLQSFYLKKNLGSIEPLNTWMPDTSRQTQKHIHQLLPLCGGNFTTSVSGIESRLESLPGDSNRKILQSCAINSSTTSFSDGQLVGSQGKAGLASMTSAKMVGEVMKVKSKRSNLSGEVSNIKSNENLAMVAENSVRSPTKDYVGKVNEKHRKRKRILEAVESIEYLYNETKKMHLQIEEKMCLLHDLNGQTEKPSKKSGRAISNGAEDSLAFQKKFQKRRKALCQKKIGMQHLLDENEMKLNKLDTKICRRANDGRQSSQPVSDRTDCCQPCLEELNDSVLNQPQTLETFGNLAGGDYMRLLNLDSATDEECYRRAMETPLSPTLPDINASGAESSALDDFEPLADELHKGLLDEIDYQLHSRSYDVIDDEIKSNYTHCCNSSLSGDMLTYRSKDQFDRFLMQGSYRMDFCDSVQAEENGLQQVGDFVVGMPVTIFPAFGCERPEFLSEIKYGIVDNCIPYSCFLFSKSKDCYSISRIFLAIRDCTGRCCLTTQKEWMMHGILAALKMEHKLLPEEKTCVFFSLLLLNFTVAALHKYDNFFNCKTCLDSFSRHISEAMLDVEVKSLFAEILCLDKLLVLIEDFISDGRVLSCTDASLETLNEGDDARVNIFLDGINRTFSLAPASAYYLVAGSSILASISKAVDCTRFLCGVSYNILRMSRYESSLMLTMLHVFAQIGGDQFFSLDGYSTLMVVVKALVMHVEGHLEGVRLSYDATLTPRKKICRTEFIQCGNCPFSEKFMTLPMVVSFLLGLLQKNISHETMDEDLLNSSNSLNPRAFSGRNRANQISSNISNCEVVHQALCMECDDSYGLKKIKVSDDLPGSVLNAELCDVSDIMSLVELLACYMSWNWTCINIIPQLLKILESSVKESFTLAIVILLGQLGRFGVDAGGFEDDGVKILRSNLSAFLCLDTTIKSALFVQIAIVSSLLGLLPFDVETIVQDEVRYSAVSSQYFEVNLIKKWFSLLSPKQKELSFNILHVAV